MKIKVSLGFFIILFAVGLVSCDNSTSTTGEVDAESQDSLSITSPEIEILDSLIKESPKDANLYYQRAVYYRDVDFAPAALRDIYSAINLDSSRADFYYLGGDLYIQMRDGEGAIALMAEGINKFPADEELYLRATEYNFLMREYQPALNFVNDLLEINQYNADAYFLKAMIYKDLGNFEKAKSTFQTCAEQDPTFYNAYMQLGLLFTEDDDEMAISYFDNALRLLPESREAMYGKAYFYQKVKDYNTAVKEYRNLISYFPKDHVSFFNIGHCYMYMDSLDKSFSHFNIATQLEPQYAGAYYMKGVVAEKAGDIPTAISNYEQAQLMMPDNEDVQKALDRLQ